MSARTPVQRNTPRTVPDTRPVPPGGNILPDRIGHLPARQAKNRKNPFHKAVREVQVKIDTGKVLRILTKSASQRKVTRFEAPAYCFFSTGWPPNLINLETRKQIRRCAVILSN